MKHVIWRCVAICALLISVALPFVQGAPLQARAKLIAAATPQDWPTYLHDISRTAASGETILNTGNASTLTKQWSYLTGGGLATSAAIVNGVAYMGSWDGYEYALNATTGALVWKTFLGTTTANCNPPTLGITSGAAVVGGVVYVGGGDANWYALDANTGAVLWSVNTGDNSATGGHYNWASPLIYNNFAYIGIASNCDNPLVQGQVLKVDLTSHAVVSTANLVPNGEVGAGVWTSPALDTATNTIFVTTGTQAQTNEAMAQAIVSLDATTLAVKDYWNIPASQRVNDADWGTTPVLFTDSGGRQLVAAVNKNGYLYTFLRSNLSAGPVWEQQIAFGGNCPQCGDGGISSGAFANGTLYFAAGNTSINGVGYPGSVRAFDPATGNILWAHGDEQPIFAAIAYDNGLIMDGFGNDLEVLDASSGSRLYSYATNAPIYSAPAVWGGNIYVGSLDKSIYSIGLPSSIATIPPDPNCPTAWTCQDINNQASQGSESVSGATWSVTAAGAGIQGASDQFRLISKPTTGDAQVTTQILTEPTSNSGAQNGVIMRQSNDPGSPFYGVMEYANDTPDGISSPTIRVLYRTIFGSALTQAILLSPAALPGYLMIQRSGDVFTAATSTDGVNYQLIAGSRIVLPLPATVLAGNAVDSGIAATYLTDTYATPTIGAPNIQVSPAPMASPCPSSWNCYDVGAGSPVGSQTLSSSGQWTLLSSGTTIGGYADQFHFVYQNLTGDGSVQAHVVSQTNTAAGARAGVMLRQSVDPGSAYYGVFVTPSNGVIVQYRGNQGLRTSQVTSISGTTPVYLEVTRYTDTRVSPSVTYYSAYTSSDGVNWTFVPWSSAPISMGNTLLAGVAASTYAGGTQGTDIMDSVSISSATSAPPTLCPTTWNCTDVYNPEVSGSQAVSNGVWSVQGGGADIWGTTDSFHYVSTALPADGGISAHVASQTNTDPWAKGGVMLRATTDADSPYYAALITPANGLVVQYRTLSGGGTSQVKFVGTTAPLYLKVARYTDTSTTPATTYFTAYTSTDGTTWTALAGTTVNFPMTGTIQAGLAVTSHSTGTAGVVTYDTVAVSNSAPVPPISCPPSFSCADIGGATPAGSQTLSSGTWTIQAGGADIWNNTDSFHFVWQSLAADGKVSAQVTSQTNTDPWAKAGVMIRATADAGSPYYAALVTPGNGLVVQYRTTQGGATSQAAHVTGTVAPIYLQVARTTDNSTSPATINFTAYTSTDGVTWALVPNSAVSLNMTGAALAGMAATSHTNNASGADVFNAFTITATTPPPPTCPSGWSCADIGGVGLTGSQSLSNGAWTIQGAGGDVWGTADAFHFVWQSLAADGGISAHVASQANTNAWAKAGVMLRASTDPAAPYYAALITPSNGLVVQYRSAAAGATTTAAQVTTATLPTYLKVERYTDNSTTPATTEFTAYTSADGVTWTAVSGSTVSMPLTGVILSGMAVTSHTTTALSAVTFDTVTLTTSATRPTGLATCPSGWSCADVGAVGLAGSQIVSGGTWTVQGAGSDIWNTSDSFHFVWQSLATDGGIAAHISSQTNTNAWAKAGVMLRASTAANSPFYAALITPSNGLAVEYRSVAGGTASKIAFSGKTTPIYLKVARYTDTTTTPATIDFTAYTSTDGVTWTALNGSTVSLPMSGTILTGLAVTSHTTTALSAVSYDTITVATSATPPTPAPTCPSGWSCADIGGVGQTGSQSLSNGAWTIQGAGGDIYGTADSFHYVWQSLAADGAVSAQVTSQTNTNAWAKAGVMLRSSAATNSPYYAALITPSNGLVVQYRSALGGTTTTAVQVTTATAPTYLKVTRAGTTFNAYTSTDGVTWTLVTGSTVTLTNVTGSLFAGMSVTSHNSSTLSTVVFNAVTVG